VVPTFNESGNVAALVNRLTLVLVGIEWEIVFVDDDSPDGTAARIREIAGDNSRVRCLRRIGRRGLSSASIEGMLSTSAPFLAVMDADLQHDEALIPAMLARLKQAGTDLVVASRYVGSGTAAGLSSERRKFLSRAGVRLGRRLIKTEITDPVSGFFMLRRETLDAIAPRLSGVGTKILIDILASSPKPLVVAELPYEFRPRHTGESKLDALTALEYALLLAEKFGGPYLPHKMLLFGLVGATGVIVNLAVIRALLALEFSPIQAVTAATIVAMASNFFLNNILTYRDRRLTGWRALRGLLSFMAICGLGAFVNRCSRPRR
jgi:dolichol-phosphate mannosyltransferase